MYAISCIAMESPKTLYKFGDRDWWSEALSHNLKMPNRAVIFMKHSSEASDGDFGDYDNDSDGLPVIRGDKFNRNYFTMTYTDNESCHEDGINNKEEEEED